MDHKDEKDTDNKEKTGEDKVSHEDHKKKKKKDEIVEELNNTIEEKEEMIKALQEKLLYLQADFDNFKKLKIKERQDTLKFGNEVLVKELLPVLDNLERALDHASKTKDFKGIHDGVKIVFNEFLKVLERTGVERVDALGKKFDPNFHEAFMQEEKDDVEPDTVVSEMQKGYIPLGWTKDDRRWTMDNRNKSIFFNRVA